MQHAGISWGRATASLAWLVSALLASSARADEAQLHYLLHCQGCHLADGSGSPGAVPNLVGSVGRFLTVPGGRAYLVQVPGSAQSDLDDAQLAAVLDWMVVRFGPSEVAVDFERFSAEEVARVRAVPLADPAAVRERLMERLDGSASRRSGARSE